MPSIAGPVCGEVVPDTAAVRARSSVSSTAHHANAAISAAATLGTIAGRGGLDECRPLCRPRGWLASTPSRGTASRACAFTERRQCSRWPAGHPPCHYLLVHSAVNWNPRARLTAAASHHDSHGHHRGFPASWPFSKSPRDGRRRDQPAIPRASPAHRCCWQRRARTALCCRDIAATEAQLQERPTGCCHEPERAPFCVDPKRHKAGLREPCADEA
mmetsp:Transcript_102819/g.286287  ORF Transcript_102819/g.286287 Transcript_102819/m.286287 type:complete len:216 (+) Transcript_102819:777-1424(+)